MKRITLQRVAGNDVCTTGVMIYNYRPFCVTLERPWLGNKPDISCIPAGTYMVEKAMSPERGYEVWWVREVPDRDSIQMHKGNIPVDTAGCILVAEKFEPINGAEAVQESAAAWNELNSIMGPDRRFALTVRHWTM
jgi:hypothetical protein